MPRPQFSLLQLNPSLRGMCLLCGDTTLMIAIMLSTTGCGFLVKPNRTAIGSHLLFLRVAVRLSSGDRDLLRIWPRFWLYILFFCCHWNFANSCLERWSSYCWRPATPSMHWPELVLLSTKQHFAERLMWFELCSHAEQILGFEIGPVTRSSMHYLVFHLTSPMT